VRSIADYAAFSGLDYAARTIEERAYRSRVPATAAGD
jgi:hypothetical protein